MKKAIILLLILAAIVISGCSIGKTKADSTKVDFKDADTYRVTIPPGDGTKTFTLNEDGEVVEAKKG